MLILTFTESILTKIKSKYMSVAPWKYVGGPFGTLEVMFLVPCKWLGTFLIKLRTKWLIAMENVRF